MRRGEGTYHNKLPTIKHSKPSQHWYDPAKSAAHAIDRGIHDVADYFYNYDPLRKDLPRKRRRR